ncbi:hypothetical protein GCM10017687_58450 [Streptomyces echinatus]
MLVTAGAGRTEAWHAGQAAYDRLARSARPGVTDTERCLVSGRGPVSTGAVHGAVGPDGVGGWARTRRGARRGRGDARQDQLFVAEDGTPWCADEPAPGPAGRRHPLARVPRREYDRLAGDGFRGSAGRGRPRVRRCGRWGVVGADGLASRVAGMLLVRGAAPGWCLAATNEPRQELIDL